MPQAKQQRLAELKSMDKLIRAKNMSEATGPAKPAETAPSAKDRAIAYAKSVPRPKVSL